MTGFDNSARRENRPPLGFAVEAFALCFAMVCVNGLAAAAFGLDGRRAASSSSPEAMAADLRADLLAYLLSPGRLVAGALMLVLGLRLLWIFAEARDAGWRRLRAVRAASCAGVALAFGLAVLGVPQTAIQVLEGVLAW